MSEALPPESDGPNPRTPTGQAASKLPPFSPRRFRRELLVDSLLRTGAGVSLFAAFFTLLSIGGGSSVVATLLAVAIVVGWIALSALGAKVAAALPAVTALLEKNPRPANPPSPSCWVNAPCPAACG